MKEIIEIEKMEVFAFHGCYDAEKKIGNKFEIYLQIVCDATKAAYSDDVVDTVSYLALYATIRKEMAITANILESVAQRILLAIQSEYPTVESAKIKISKMNPPLGGDIERVSVTMML